LYNIVDHRGRTKRMNEDQEGSDPQYYYLKYRIVR
jgi:hypothetical protein